MCCKTPFKSAWKGNRLCMTCGTYTAGGRGQYD
jgi:hypothetical protein